MHLTQMISHSKVQGNSKVAAWASDWIILDMEVSQGTVRSWDQP
jgi:hypothetical protein